MKVRLYTDALKLVEKSGVGQAVHHQQAMLKRVGVPVAFHSEPDVDIVHINTVFPDSVAAAILAKLRGQMVVYYGHSTMEDFRNSFRCSNLLAPLFKCWIKLCYSIGDVVITPTEYSRLLLSYGLRRPIYALSNGIDTDFFSFHQDYRNRFRAKYHLKEHEKAVISVGHYIQRKGILDFLTLARTMPDVHFFWFGYTNLNLVPCEVRQAIANAPDNVIFPGYAEREELRDAYCGCDAFCFMSYEETEGIVVLEALSCGIPTLLRDIPVYHGWLKNGENVYLAKDLSGFARQLDNMLHETLPDISPAARQTAMRHRIPVIGRQLLTIYQQCLSHQPTRVNT